MPSLREINKKEKKTRKTITLVTKLEVLRRIERGEKIVNICNAMGLAKSTVQTIRDKKEGIKIQLLSAAPLSVSRLSRHRSSIMETMEKLLAKWIEVNNERKIPISQMIIQEKAKSIFDNLKKEQKDTSLSVTFQASRGWFEKFKNRHNLHSLKIKGETDATKEHGNTNGSDRPEQYFNVDERGVYLKRNPERTFILKYPSSEFEYNEIKDRDPLSFEELIHLEKELDKEEEVKRDKCQQLTVKNLSNALCLIEQGLNILLKNDPDQERSAKVSQRINSDISCYKKIQKQRKARRKTLIHNLSQVNPKHRKVLHINVNDF